MQLKLKKRYANALLGLGIFVACFTVFAFVINQETPKILFVSGTSMFPTYLPFDMLLIEDVVPEEVYFGDVVVLDNTSSYITGGSSYMAHRVVWMKVLPHRTTIGTQGDNNPEMDRNFRNTDELLGIVFQRIPLVGLVLAPPFSFGIIAGSVLLFLFRTKKSTSKKIK